MSGARGPWWLWVLTGLLLAGFVVVIAGAVTRTPDTPAFALRAADPREPPRGPAGPDTVTLDARHPEQWARFDLLRRRLAGPGEPWDLAARRHQLRVNSTAADSGSIAWYDYGFFSHVLAPRPDTLRVPTSDGREALVRVLSYYCPGPEAGCYTLEVRLP